MLVPTMIVGWIGILIFLVIVVTFQKMMKNNEYAFLHVLMAIMYAMWFPLPLAFNHLLLSDTLLVGSLFGYAYLVLLVITMVLQSGHIIFITKHNDEHTITDTHGNYLMATLTHPFESLAGVFKSIWAIFLAIAFWQNGEELMAGLMLFFGILLFYYLFIMLDASLIKRVRLLMKVKPIPYITNLETLIFFLILMSYITFM